MKVLQTGQEINEVDQSGFSTQGSTVFAGNLGANRYIVQVTQMGVRLLQGIEQVSISKCLCVNFRMKLYSMYFINVYNKIILHVYS